MAEAKMKKELPFLEAPFAMSGAAGRIRTHDPLVRSQVLYPTELQPPRENETIACFCDSATRRDTFVAMPQRCAQALSSSAASRK